MTRDEMIETLVSMGAVITSSRKQKDCGSIRFKLGNNIYLLTDTALMIQKFDDKEEPYYSHLWTGFNSLYEKVNSHTYCIMIDIIIKHLLVSIREGELKEELRMRIHRYLMHNGKLVERVPGDYYSIGCDGCAFKDGRIKYCNKHIEICTSHTHYVYSDKEVVEIWQETN